jgi:hypothetical protein
MVEQRVGLSPAWLLDFGADSMSEATYDGRRVTRGT